MTTQFNLLSGYVGHYQMIFTGKAINIEYGIIDFENVNFETAISNITSTKLTSKAVTSNLTSKTVTSTVKTGSNGVPVGWGWGGPPC